MSLLESGIILMDASVINAGVSTEILKEAVYSIRPPKLSIVSMTKPSISRKKRKAID